MSVIGVQDATLGVVVSYYIESEGVRSLRRGQR